MNINVDWLQVGALIGVIATVIGGFAALWFRIEGRFRANEDNLAAQRLHVAETYITKSGFRDATEQIMSAIADVKGSLDQMRDRIDRAFDKTRATRSA